jgi:hypothetical protein
MNNRRTSVPPRATQPDSPQRLATEDGKTTQPAPEDDCSVELTDSRRRLEEAWERLGFGSNPPSCLDEDAESLVAALEELYETDMRR